MKKAKVVSMSKAESDLRVRAIDLALRMPDPRAFGMAQSMQGKSSAQIITDAGVFLRFLKGL